MSRFRTILAVPVLAVTVSLGSPVLLADANSLERYGKILVYTGAEDTNSLFHSVYFYDKGGKLVRLIEMWNGGCCHAPAAEDFAVDGTRLTYIASFEIENKGDSMVADVLCKPLPTKRIKDPPVPELEDPEILRQYAETFAGCR